MENAREAHYRNGLKIIRNPWGDCHGGRSLGKRQHWGILQISPSLSSALLRECLPHPLSVSPGSTRTIRSVPTASIMRKPAEKAPSSPIFRNYPGGTTASYVHFQKPNYMPLPQSSLSYILKILLLPDSGPTTKLLITDQEFMKTLSQSTSPSTQIKSPKVDLVDLHTGEFLFTIFGRLLWV